MAENQVGTVGMMYEDRKSGKLGVLESRNEKFKTLMFRDEEGKTFNIQYSTFRSNWRKYQGEKKIQTSTQVQATADRNEKKVAKAKENLKEPKKGKTANADDRRKSPLTAEEKNKLITDVASVVKATVEAHTHDIFTYEYKFIHGNGRNRVLCGKKEVFDIYARTTKNDVGLVRFYTTKETFEKAKFSKAVGKIEATFSTNPKELRPVTFKLSTDLLEQAIADMLDSLAPVFADKVKNEEK